MTEVEIEGYYNTGNDGECVEYPGHTGKHTECSTGIFDVSQVDNTIYKGHCINRGKIFDRQIFGQLVEYNSDYNYNRVEKVVGPFSLFYQYHISSLRL